MDNKITSLELDTLTRLKIYRNELARAIDKAPPGKDMKWPKLYLQELDKSIAEEVSKAHKQSGYTCADCGFTQDNRRKFTRFRGDYICMNCAIGDNAIGKRAKISLDNPHTTRKESV